MMDGLAFRAKRQGQARKRYEQETKKLLCEIEYPPVTGGQTLRQAKSLSRSCATSAIYLRNVRRARRWGMGRGLMRRVVWAVVQRRAPPVDRGAEAVRGARCAVRGVRCAVCGHVLQTSLSSRTGTQDGRVRLLLPKTGCRRREVVHWEAPPCVDGSMHLNLKQGKRRGSARVLLQRSKFLNQQCSSSA